MWIWPLGREDPLDMVTHSSILAWRTPRTEGPGRLQSTQSQRVRDDWARACTHARTHTHTHTHSWKYLARGPWSGPARAVVILPSLPDNRDIVLRWKLPFQHLPCLLVWIFVSGLLLLKESHPVQFRNKSWAPVLQGGCNCSYQRDHRSWRGADQSVGIWFCLPTFLQVSLPLCHLPLDCISLGPHSRLTCPPP